MKAKLILMGVGAAVVLTGLWFMFLWKPAGEDLDSAKADKAASEQKAQQLEVRLAHLKKLEKNAAVLEADKQRFLTAMPDTDRLDEFLHQVNERAARAGVSFQSVSPTQPDAADAPAAAAGTGPVSIGLQMQASGDYFQVLRFLDELRDGPRIMTVESFALSKVGESGQMSASIGGRMFMNPAAAAAAPIPNT